MALRTENTNNGFHVDFNDQRCGSTTSTGSIDTLEIPVKLGNPTSPKLKGRTRSNSKVYNNSNGNKLWAEQPSIKPALPPSVPISISPSSSLSPSKEKSQSPTPLVVDNTRILNGVATENLPERSEFRSSLNRKTVPRESFIYVLILTSLNETFDRKTLKIPNYPEVLKLGRPNNSQRTPSVFNGYFDSRVISREHAEVHVKDGKLFINDLNSANGTFVNNNKILKEEEIKIGDAIDLGIDIANENKPQHQRQQHRKISCKLENFLTLSVDGTTDTTKVLADLNKRSSINKIRSVAELTPFDAGMFGDVSNDLEDLSLGINHDFLTGIFVNNNINTSSNLVQPIKLLMNQLHQEKLNNLKLQSVEQFLRNFSFQLDGDDDLTKLKRTKRELYDQKNRAKTLTEKLKDMRSIITQHEKTLTKADEYIQSRDEKLERVERELQNERAINRENVTKIQDLELSTKEKDVFISHLQEQQFESMATLEDEAKLLKNELAKKDGKIKELEAFKERALKSQSSNEVLLEIYRTGFTITGVLVVGLVLLKIF